MLTDARAATAQPKLHWQCVTLHPPAAWIDRVVANLSCEAAVPSEGMEPSPDATAPAPPAGGDAAVHGTSPDEAQRAAIAAVRARLAASTEYQQVCPQPPAGCFLT